MGPERKTFWMTDRLFSKGIITREGGRLFVDRDGSWSYGPPWLQMLLIVILIGAFLGTIEACQYLKHLLGAASIEHVIEHQQDESFSRFLVEIPASQVAYSAYRTARAGKAHDGSTLPFVLSAEMSVAWEAFAAAVMAGHGVDLAYQAYLAARLGVDFNGNAAPDWDELRNNKPDIAAAWADAANALK